MIKQTNGEGPEKLSFVLQTSQDSYTEKNQLRGLCIHPTHADMAPNTTGLPLSII